MEYRAYPVDDDGHLLAPKLLEAGSDEEAIAQLKAMLNGRPIELWESDRMIGWFERTQTGITALRIPATPPA